MDEETKKLLISTALSVGLIFVGWFLAQGTNAIQTWWQNRRIKRGLFTELQDLLISLTALRRYYMDHVRGHSVGFIQTDDPIPLNNYIFSQRYGDISLQLNRNQRFSYETIHSFVSNFNKSLETISEMSLKAIETKDEDIVDKLGESLKVQYVNLEMLRWRIHFHLTHRRDPKFETDDEAVAEYISNQQTWSDEIDSIVESTQKGGLEDYLNHRKLRYELITIPPSGKSSS